LGLTADALSSPRPIDTRSRQVALPTLREGLTNRQTRAAASPCGSGPQRDFGAFSVHSFFSCACSWSTEDFATAGETTQPTAGSSQVPAALRARLQWTSSSPRSPPPLRKICASSRGKRVASKTGVIDLIDIVTDKARLDMRRVAENRLAYEAREIAATVLSDDFRWVTGQHIEASGGARLSAAS